MKFSIYGGMFWFFFGVVLAVVIGISYDYSRAANRVTRYDSVNCTIQEVPYLRNHSNARIFYFKNGYTQPSMMGSYTDAEYDDDDGWTYTNYCVAPVVYENWTVCF